MADGVCGVRSYEYSRETPPLCSLLGEVLAPLFEPGRDLRQEDAVTSLVDVALLPKAIGGDASSIAENGEEDERCVRGFKFPSVNDYVACLECLK